MNNGINGQVLSFAVPVKVNAAIFRLLRIGKLARAIRSLTADAGRIGVEAQKSWMENGGCIQNVGFLTVKWWFRIIKSGFCSLEHGFYDFPIQLGME